MHNHQFLYKLSIITLIAMMGLIIYLFYLLFRPYHIIDIAYIKIEQPATAGEHVRVEQSYCKYMDIPGSVSVMLSNGVNIPIAQFNGSLSEGCDVFTFELPLPGYIEPGEYKFKFISRYQPNPIRTIDIVFESEPFSVIIKE